MPRPTGDADLVETVLPLCTTNRWAAIFAATVLVASTGCVSTCTSPGCGRWLDQGPLTLAANALADGPAGTGALSGPLHRGANAVVVHPNLDAEVATSEAPEAASQFVGSGDASVLVEGCVAACDDDTCVAEVVQQAVAMPAARPGGYCRILDRPVAGPPPSRYQPKMPPTFLPVPVQPVLPPAAEDAPQHVIGDVEIDFGSRLSFPGRD
ncbi:MAG: hypothetical protein KDA61_08350 [Planctomycetales bacterium]|nr:hypothetical protein [Planctomycetales bacterium]